MSLSRVALIVSGHGETAAVPVLIRRIASRVDPSMGVDMPVVFRVPEDRLRKSGELERYVELSARKLDGKGGLFILLDCDWPSACAKQDAPQLLSRAQAVRPTLPLSLVLACMEYEAWFIAAPVSLRGKCGLAPDLEVVEDPESIRGAKSWLSKRMPRGSPYAETIHQASLTEAFDLDEARRSPSFDKCCRSLEWLLTKSIVSI